jgi:hypothetical protein
MPTLADGLGSTPRLSPVRQADLAKTLEGKRYEAIYQCP